MKIENVYMSGISLQRRDDEVNRYIERGAPKYLRSEQVMSEFLITGT